MHFLIIFNSLIFFALAILHVYWAFGGEIDVEKVIPSIEGKELAFGPPPLVTVVVAVGLLLFGLVLMSNLGSFDTFVSEKMIKYITYGIGVIFLLRAMGDFKYVGMTKRIKNSIFAEYDTKYYIPLCLFLGISAVLIAYFA